ncbi:MAG: hypothetical protein QOH88_3152 [Verrucomicrobiota bacterium]|jgi:hypothetical protein
MSDWKIVSEGSGSDLLMGALSLGLWGLDGHRDYTVENTETGETRTVNARDAEEVGRMISRGQFSD